MLFRPLKDDILEYFAQRSKLAVLVVFIFCLIILGRLVHLQIFKYEELYTLSDNNRIRVLRVRADRGFIKDRNRTLIVKNAPAFEVEFIKEDAKDIYTVLDNLSEVLNINKENALKRINRTGLYEPAQIMRGLDFEKLSYLTEHSADFPGVQLSTAPTRSYTNGEILSHLIGYLGEINDQEITTMSGYVQGDTIGKSGLEKEFENMLRGQDGSRRVVVDHVGRVIETISEEPSIQGKNIVLSIDYNLQEHIATLFEGRQGSAIVIDGDDGSLLAMYSAPTYDLNMFNPFINSENWGKLMNDPYKPLLNRSVEGAYPPGSVFKPLVAIAGLMEGVVTEETKFYCGGSYRVSPRSNVVHNCWKRGGHGELNLVRALAVSCDVYFYNLGTQLGIDKLNEYAKKFNLGHVTGIALPNEKTGVFPSREWKLKKLKEPWYPGETVNISIGQGYTTTTPLQVASMISSIFNGGTVYVPRIVLGYEDPYTEEFTGLPAQVSYKTEIPKKYRDIVMKGLLQSVESPGGTSWRGRVKGVAIGGKTGTAQVVSLKRVENLKEDEIPEHWRDHSWYTGTFPAEKPKYTVVVMMEHGGSGGKSSAPVGASIVEKMVELGYVQKH